jgi:hypothetical protein
MIEDKYNLVFCIQVLFGLGFLMPFLTVLGLLDYYIEIMPGYSPQSAFPFWYNCTAVPSVIFYAIYGRRFNQHRLIVVGFSAGVVIFSIAPWIGRIGGTVGYWGTVGCLAVYGIFQGVCQGAIYA